jgi:hypothetical protein
VAAADDFCAANGVLPGYALPTVEGEEPPAPTTEMSRILRQVDGLMEMVMGEAYGVRAA